MLTLNVVVSDISYITLFHALSRSAEKDCSALLKAKNQLALDLERLLSHKEVAL